MHEARLHVHAQHDAEPDEIDADLVGCRPDQRNDDEGDLEEIEEERKEEHQHVDEYEKADLTSGERCQQMLHPKVTVHAVEGQREDARANENEHDERGQLGGGFDR